MINLAGMRGLRVVGDVHGDFRAFARAAETDLFLLQLGDLVDYGPDSASVLRLMFQLIDERRGAFLLGNHDIRLGRALAGRPPRSTDVLASTLAQLDDALRSRALNEISHAPAWLRHQQTVFVHAGFHTEMLAHDPPAEVELTTSRVDAVLSRALYGEPTGRTQADGFPERSLRWVDRIPAGVTVYCGHDRRSSDGRPYRRQNVLGGTAIFLDTGAGKGGHLSWIDLPSQPQQRG
jgi:protein phosphatase